MTPAVILVQVLAKKAQADLAATKMALRGVRTETRMVGDQMVVMQKHTFAANQALFTMRRIAYGLTLGVIGLAAVAVKMGFDFNSAVNRAQVGFKGFINGTQAINDEVTKIYYLAAKTPFEFPDILLATQRLIPYNRNLQEVNDTVDAISNSLAAQGVAQKQYLTRATIQFAHIYALGRVTGQQVNALARDNIPLTAMLAQHYHTTTAAITDMIHQGLVPASAATQALIAYQNNPGFRGKNLMIATQTLSGAWATVKDIIRFSVGSREQGIFEHVRKGLQGVATQMLPFAKAGKPITVTMLAEAFDRELTPTTHIIINLFELFRGVLTGLIFGFVAFFKVISVVSSIFNKVTGSGKAFRDVLFVIGFIVGLTTALFITYRTALVFYAIASGIATAATWLFNGALITYDYLMIAAAVSTGGMVLALTALAAAELLVIGALVILYFRWKRFHDIVNATAQFLYKHWYLLSFIPIFGPMLAAIVVVVRNWNHLANAMQRVYDLAIKIKNVGSAIVRPGGRGHFWNRSARSLLGLQSGGVVTSGGGFMVGEAGPEVVHLPRGAAVTPNTALAGAAGAFSLTIEPADIYLDGRKISEVVFKHKLDRIARR